ncbi:MAG TPA: hypothetical protein DCQ06_07460 [Myxococcales bacterium]|nr:hypothetical protein [Myxococcales bacterium]HAN31419.1 hypothetical protein [Myxococcales bacterium]
MKYALRTSCSMVAGVAVIWLSLAVSSGASPAAIASITRPRLLSDVAESTVKSVVNISVQAQSVSAHPLREYFGPRMRPTPRRRRGLGSGVIVSAQGVILTNNHVVRGATKIEVTLHNGVKVQARLVGADPQSDLAVIRLRKPVPDLRVMSFADSDKVRLGQVVLAIGSPFGLSQTVTSGIVSAKSRANVGINDYEDFIQTDAAINPGNSGGALVDLHGRLVGINTAIASRSGGSQGIGFAIPANMAAQVLKGLMSDGKVDRGWLGVAIQQLTSRLAEAFDLTDDTGVLVAQVQPGSPAAQSGLKQGDVITAVDQVKTPTPARLRNVIARRGSKVSVVLSLWRRGKKQEVSVTLGRAPTRSKTAKAHQKLVPKAKVRWGVQVAADERNGALTVMRVVPASPAARAGLQPADVIVSAQGKTVRSAQQFFRIARAVPSGKSLLLRVRNRVMIRYVVLTP